MLKVIECPRRHRRLPLFEVLDFLFYFIPVLFTSSTHLSMSNYEVIIFGFMRPQYSPRREGVWL